MPFFTELDPNARVKGSRDPLGFEIIWTNFGRRLIKNLTTVTDNLEDFAIGLVGHVFAHDAATAHNAKGDQIELSDYFLRFEQLAAYSRYRIQAEKASIRGKLRVRQYYSHLPVLIDHTDEAQIMSNQKTYGIWGLYTSALRATGMIEENTHRVSEFGREAYEQSFKDGLSLYEKRISEFVRKGGWFDPTTADDRQLAEVLNDMCNAQNNFEAVKENFFKVITLGGQKSDPQYTLYKIIEDNKISIDQPVQNFAVELLNELRDNNDLYVKLDNIIKVEKILSICSILFAFLLTQNTRNLTEIISTLEDKSYDFTYLKNLLNNEMIKRIDNITSERAGTRLRAICNNLINLKYEKVIRGLLDLNREVMKRRGGDAWVYIESERLIVKYRENETAVLPENYSEIKWVHGFFLDTFQKIISDLRSI